MDQANPEVIAEMQAWAEGQGYRSLLGDEVVEPSGMTDAEVLRLMDDQYPGGADAFATDTGASDDDHIDMAPHGQWT